MNGIENQRGHFTLNPGSHMNQHRRPDRINKRVSNEQYGD